jgi:DNA-binding HxlR family transcriptional regulator
MLPDKDVEYRHAVDLVSQSARTQLDILEALMGEPSTYTGLKEVLRGRNHNVLTKALRSLRDKGLIRHGLAADLESPVYALSELGKLVLLRSHEILPHRQSIEAYERGVRAAA